MKELSEQISIEKRLEISYIICRFMNSKVAYKTIQNQRGIWVTIKKIKEKNILPQYQIHIRFNGKDYWNNEKEEIIDIDLYIPFEEFEKKILEIIPKQKPTDLKGFL